VVAIVHEVKSKKTYVKTRGILALEVLKIVLGFSDADRLAQTKSCLALCAFCIYFPFSAGGLVLAWGLLDCEVHSQPKIAPHVWLTATCRVT
jgi:hypothetical protein